MGRRTIKVWAIPCSMTNYVYHDWPCSALGRNLWYYNESDLFCQGILFLSQL